MITLHKDFQLSTLRNNLLLRESPIILATYHFKNCTCDYIKNNLLQSRKYFITY